ncbi:MAG: hypothetical protein AABZ53_14085 [Planctomycetota bacterium]
MNSLDEGNQSSTAAVESGRPDILARVLGGPLPCARCRYDLKGLSVRSVCPECGTPVRGTILATVDPLASELQPIRFPLLISGGLLTWSAASLAAALIVLVLRVNEISAGFRHPLIGDVPILRVLPAALVVVAGLGSLSLVRPHAGISVLHSFAALLGSLAHLPLAYLMWQIHDVIDVLEPAPFSVQPGHALLRSMLRLGCAACLTIIILGVRPNGRLLVSRSLLMRTGRVDRQTMLVILGAVGLAALGDALRLANPALEADSTEVFRQIGSLFIAVGSTLVLAGLVGILADAFKLRYSITSRPLSLSSILPPPKAAVERTPTHMGLLDPTAHAPQASQNLGRTTPPDSSPLKGLNP